MVADRVSRESQGVGDATGGREKEEDMDDDIASGMEGGRERSEK